MKQKLSLKYVINIKDVKLLGLVALVALGIISRIWPHPPNMTAIGASAILAGVIVKSRWLALLIPFLSLLVSDLILGFHSTMWSVYLAMGISTGIGQGLKGRTTWVSWAGGGVLSSVIFYLITNFAVWAEGMLYPRTYSGFVDSYVMAIPFFGYQLLGDLIFISVFFFAWQKAEKPTGLQLGSFPSPF